MNHRDRHLEPDPVFVALQQKLKLRRELDEDIENLIYSQVMRRNQTREFDKNIQATQRYKIKMAESQEKYRKYIEHKIQQKAYLYEDSELSPHPVIQKGLDTYEKQLFLGKLHDRQLDEAIKDSFYAKNNLQLQLENSHRNIQYDDEELIAQYQNGTRARQMQNLIETYRPSIPIIPIRQAIYLNSQQVGSERAGQQNEIEFSKPQQEVMERSPYKTDKLQKSKNLMSPYSNLNEKNNAEFPSKQQVLQHQSPHKSGEYLSRKGFDSQLPPRRSKVTSFSFNLKPAVNPQKSKRDNNVNKKKGKFGKDKSCRQKDKTINKSIFSKAEDNGMKKISNRLKYSKCVFKDSKFRNLKHEYVHLQMTYQNEVKTRRQIKDKLNKDPSILKKYAMVVNNPLS